MRTSDNNEALLEKITSTLRRISGIEISVRDHINTTRYQMELLKDSDNWNQICSSLDTIGDTLYSIKGYIGADYPDNDGLKYIFTYGILQALFIQQEAIKHLSEAFDVPYKTSEKLFKIRIIRNAAIGHPTKNDKNRDNITYYNYISRMTLNKWGFTLLRSSKKDRNAFIDVDLISILDEQTHEIEKSYKLLSEKLNEADRMHKEKYKDSLIGDIFHQVIHYQFEKVSEAIHSPSYHNGSLGLSMLASIENAYIKFETALSQRNELNEYIRHDLDEYKHAITVLKAYLSNENETMLENDANVYLFYLRENHKRFVDIAKEIDDEYVNKQAKRS